MQIGSVGLRSPGDMTVDGGNSTWTEPVVRHATCAEHAVTT